MKHTDHAATALGCLPAEIKLPQPCSNPTLLHAL